MVYTSPTKVARIVTFKSQGMKAPEITEKMGIHCTIVGRIINRYNESSNFYHVRPKSGCLHVLQERETRLAARMLAKVAASNVTKLQKEYFPGVGAQTLCRCLKDHSLMCCVCKTKPYLIPAAIKKRRKWALQHVSWMVEQWKKVIFSDESKFMLFKSDGHQYAWFRPGQAYNN